MNLLIVHRWKKFTAVVIILATFFGALLPLISVNAMEMDMDHSMGCEGEECFSEHPVDGMHDCIDHCLEVQNAQEEPHTILSGTQVSLLAQETIAFQKIQVLDHSARGSPDVGKRARHLSVQKRE